MHSLVLTGPSAAGKNAVAGELRKMHPGLAVLDVDAIRRVPGRPVIPNAAYCELSTRGLLPAGEEVGAEEWRTGVAMAVEQARALARHHDAVAVLDLLSAESARVWRHELQRVLVVMLLPTREEIHRRYRKRAGEEGHSRLGDDALIDLLYDHQQGFKDYDFLIDNTDVSATDAAARIAGLIR